MTNETRERIKYYKEKLPHMKEKLLAAIMMLVIAASVTVTATYAWATLSSAPEVTSVATSVAANGSLEIALATGNGLVPGKSAEGDSTGAGTALSVANTTWGNLINLSDDDVYGLSKITLRPAALNGKSGLLTAPLYGVEYGEDGRISNRVYDEDFLFSYYDGSIFRADVDAEDQHLGVRAITTVKYENTSGDSEFRQLSSSARSAYQDAGEAYEKIIANSRYVNSLQGLIQLYAQSIIDGAKDYEIDVTSYMPDFYNMVNDLLNDVMIPMGESYVSMSKMLDLITSDSEGIVSYNTVEELLAAYDAGTIPAYITENIGSLGSYIADVKSFQNYLNEDVDYDVTYNKNADYNLAYCKYRADMQEVVYWSNVKKIVNWLCSIYTATLDGYEIELLKYPSNAAKVVLNGDQHEAVLIDGAMFRIDKRLDSSNAMFMTISIAVDISSMMSSLSLLEQIAVNAVAKNGIVTFNQVQLMTAANVNYDKYDTNTVYELPTETAAISAKNPGKFEGSEPTAEDTYAMAIDFWVRTNAGSDENASGETTVEESTLEDGTKVETIVTKSAEQPYLILEGAVKTVTHTVPVTVKDADGNDQPAYTASFTLTADGEESQQSMDVFQLSDGKYYYIENAKNVCLEDALAENGYTDVEVTYTPKTTEEVEVLGYEGVNRVWDDNLLETGGYIGEGEISTTQGGGSCYVFYADTPADQSRFLKLLDAMKVVFVDAAGNLISSASMDTKNYFADTGKVTVPLVLDESTSINLGTDKNGNPIYGLMPLKKNAATRITALVYLDGTKLTNDMVLASGDIQGALNIQFGSSVAYQKTTTTTTQQGDSTVVDSKSEYVSGQDSEAIKNNPLMKEIIDLSAEVSIAEFTFGQPNVTDPEGYQTILSVKLQGQKGENGEAQVVDAQKVEAQFIRAISSTQGVQQQKVALTRKEGSEKDWSAGYVFTRPGNYVLRSVWVDGVEYSLAEPVKVEVKGISINSLSCAKISGSKRTVFSSDNQFKADFTLDFGNSGSELPEVNGIILDSEGQQMSVPFHYDTKANEGAGAWIGTATFTTSSTYTIKYIEVDGDYYELSENMQKTLELHLGLEVRTWISADAETLNELKQISETATPTNFGLIGKVTLQVSAEIYDNNGKEIETLSGAVLSYRREGTSKNEGLLETNLKWSKMSGKYEGQFLVDIAGNYAFSDVSFGSSMIQKCTEDSPTIKCISLKPAYYVGHTTDSYQYAPKEDAVFKVQIANSGTANIIAQMKNTRTGKVETVRGSEHIRIDDDRSDGEGNQIITWKIDIPTDGNGSQEGVWELTSLSIYDAVYDGQFRTEENPAVLEITETVDGTSKPLTITTDVVNYLHVTISGADQTFEREFMVAAEVTDMKVNVADYAGRTMDGLKIDSVQVIYDLDQSAVSLSSKDYAYAASDSAALANVTVTGTGSPEGDSKTSYQISGLTFNYAGPYELEAVNVVATLNGTAVRTKNFYNCMNADGVAVKNRAPEYAVKLIKPTVTITGVTVEAKKDFKDYIDESEVTVQNYFEDYHANVHPKAQFKALFGGGAYYYQLPQVILSLSNAGNVETNNATFVYTFGDNSEYSDSVTFNSTSSQSLYVGKNTSGEDKDETTDIVRLEGTKIVETISIRGCEVLLSNPVSIVQKAEVLETITYVIPDEYVTYYNDGTVSYPLTVTCYDGRDEVTPIKLENKLNLQYAEVSNSEKITSVDTTENPETILKYTHQSVTAGADKAKYDFYSRKELKWTETADITYVSGDLIFKGWKLEGRIYTGDEKIPLNSDSVNTNVEAVFEFRENEASGEVIPSQREFWGILDIDLNKSETTTFGWSWDTISYSVQKYPSGYTAANVKSDAGEYTQIKQIDDEGNSWSKYYLGKWTAIE